MYDTRSQVLEHVRAGEDGRMEFNEVRLGRTGVLAPNAEELAGELVAFANADGGAVLLGVDDSGTLVGIPDERQDAVEQWLVNVATQNCDPPIRPVIRKFLLQDVDGGERRILLAEVPPGLYVHRTSGGRYYTRVGSTKRDLTPPELVRLFGRRGREYVFDEQPVLDAGLEDLNQHRFEAFFGRSPTIRRPDELLLIAFARDARDELAGRVKTRLGHEAAANIAVQTFHALGLSIIGQAEGRRPTLAKVAEDETALRGLLDRIIERLLHNEHGRALIRWLAYGATPYRTQHEFTSQGEYWEYIRSQEIRSLQGELVKSYEECLIANFLYLNGIPYEYERPYEHDTATAAKSQ